MRMTPEGIQSLVDRKVYERGVEYFAEGRVISCELKDGILFARVQGSEVAPYQVKIYFAGNRDPHGECTCPYHWGELCKHAVAALLYVSRGSEIFQKTPLKLARKSLLFSDAEIVAPPILQFILPTSNNFISLSKGIKVQIRIIQGKKIISVEYPSILINPQAAFHHSSNSLYPSFHTFSKPQQYCLRLIAAFCKNSYNGIRIEPFELSLLFRESMGCEDVQFFEGKQKRLVIRGDQKVDVTIEVGHKNSKFTQVLLFTKIPGESEVLMRGELVAGRPCWLIDFEGGNIFPFDEFFDEHLLTKILVVNGSSEFPRSEFPAFANTVLKSLKDKCSMVYRDKDLEELNIIESSPVVKLYVDGDHQELMVAPEWVYKNQSFTLKDLMKADEYMPSTQDAGGWIKRDIALEKKVLWFLRDACDFQIDPNGAFYLVDTDKIIHFVQHQLPTVTGQYEVYYAPGFEERFKSRPPLKPLIHLGAEGLDWFHFDVRYKSDGIEVEFTQEDIRRQLSQGKKYVQLKNGEILPIDVGEFTRVKEMLDEFEGEAKQLSAFHSPFLIEEAARKGLKMTFNESFRQLHEKLKGFNSIEPVKSPPSLKGVLRDYQHKGLDWLEFLKGFRFGGILADEMGLGKTLQVLALIKNLADAGERLPCLVVCPTTLVWNWQAEVNKFVPDLKVVVPQGPQRRAQIEGIKDGDLVITSYGLLRRDAVYYEKISFNYMILDEAQNIKNRNTQNARMSKKIQSRYRLVMTGTPMENSIADLWSIFDFLMPGFLGGYERFRNRYELPILRDQNKQVLEMLGRKIKPFMLRRLKKEVIKELPERIEQVSFCELEPTQYKCYEQMLVLARKEVVREIKAQGFNKSRMKILTIILRLRQICCHPQLAGVKWGHRLSISGKLNLLKETLREALSGGHKVLIFSQFVGMLEIIAEYLTKEGIVFEYMDGSTRDRRGAVDRFNSSEEVKVFLLSLKVGGVGLNLTSADTVILFEPWWNPAVEDQAIDRAHRIGQKSTVMAYKLICKGTIEEKILELQKRKKNLIDSLVIAEEGIAKKLGLEDIKFLLGIE